LDAKMNSFKAIARYRRPPPGLQYKKSRSHSAINAETETKGAEPSLCVEMQGKVKKEEQALGFSSEEAVQTRPEQRQDLAIQTQGGSPRYCPPGE